MKYIYFQWIRLLKNKIAAELRINKCFVCDNDGMYELDIFREGYNNSFKK